MTIPSQFEQWLRVAERDGKGGLAAEPRAIVRGKALAMTLNLPPHPDYGDWTSGTFDAPLRAAPGAAGDPVEYDISIGAPAGGLTPITFVLDPATHADLPGNDLATGLAEVFLTVNFTPAGGARDEIIATRQLISGAV